MTGVAPHNGLTILARTQKYEGLEIPFKLMIFYPDRQDVSECNANWHSEEFIKNLNISSVTDRHCKDSLMQ